MEDEKAIDFTDIWKNVHLQERLGKPHAQEKAGDIRNVLVEIQTARAKNILDNASCGDLYFKEADKYAELIDSPEEQGGLNNYAESVLALLQGKRNESNQWKSSLSLESVAEMDFMKKYKDVCKAAKATLIPAGKENEHIPFSKVSPIPYSRNTSTNVPGTFAEGNTKTVLQNSTPNIPPVQNTHAINIGQSSGFVPARNIVQSMGQAKGPIGKNNKPQGHGLFSKVHESVGDGNNSNSGNFWNVGMDSDQYRQTRDINNQHSGAANPRFRDTSRDLIPCKQNEVSYKRGRDMEVDEQNEPTMGAPMFRTARQQLAIENQKKYGNRTKQPQGPVNNTCYGTNKKSLGTRRGLNSKFVPPVLNREDEDDGSTLVNRAGPKRSNSGGGNEEEVDERLKNIEPKMVELIMSEIMDQGQPLTWDDIAGLEFAKKTIQEIVVWPMLRPDIFTGLRGPPKGLLLFGPPGTGKTLIGKCIASQSKSTFFSISASSLTSKWVGEGEKMVRALFAVARVHQPAVVFIDEIDSLLSQRSDTEHESSRRIKTEFLVQLDGTTTGETDRILVVGATNRPQEIDEAARRRFVKRLYIPLPEAAGRRQIVHNLMTQQSHHLENEELETILEKTQGYSGADMANLCREAALGPIRSIPLSDIENITADQVRPIVYIDFEEALKQVRASVSDKDLDLYLNWNKQFGSWGM